MLILPLLVLLLMVGIQPIILAHITVFHIHFISRTRGHLTDTTGPYLLSFSSSDDTFHASSSRDTPHTPDASVTQQQLLLRMRPAQTVRTSRGGRGRGRAAARGVDVVVVHGNVLHFFLPFVFLHRQPTAAAVASLSLAAAAATAPTAPSSWPLLLLLLRRLVCAAGEPPLAGPCVMRVLVVVMMMMIGRRSSSSGSDHGHGMLLLYTGQRMRLTEDGHHATVVCRRIIIPNVRTRAPSRVHGPNMVLLLRLVLMILLLLLRRLL